ncbi:hypothetical protein MMC08_008879 [Hypocenomyce scalaris]|nr:hypothetical protein [Hypocenomyce scalaris]
MADTEPSQSFYTHDTALHDKNNPHVSILSNTLPIGLRNPIPSDAQALLQILSHERNIEHDEPVAGLNNLAIEAMMTTWLEYSDPLDRVNFVVVVEDKFEIGHFITKISPVGISGMGTYRQGSLRMTIDHALRV